MRGDLSPDKGCPWDGQPKAAAASQTWALAGAAPRSPPAVRCPFAWALPGRSADQSLSLQQRTQRNGPRVFIPPQGCSGLPPAKVAFAKERGWPGWFQDNVPAPWAETRGTKPLCCTRDSLARRGLSRYLRSVPPGRSLSPPGDGARLSPLCPQHPPLAAVIFVASLPTGDSRVLRGWFCFHNPLSPIDR